MRTVLVHDSLTARSGAERVVLQLARALGDPEVVTWAYDPERTFPELEGLTVHTLGGGRGAAEGNADLPAGPGPFRSLDLSDAEIVVLSSTAFAHHVPHPRASVYWHKPPALAGGADHGGTRHAGTGAADTGQGSTARPALAAMRQTDREAAQAHPLHLANSQWTAERLRASCGVDASVLYPAIGTEWLGSSLTEAPWPPRALVVSRLEIDERVDVAIAACREAGMPLTVVGEGPDDERLRSLADRSVTFVPTLDDAALADAYRAHAVVLSPGPGHFGLVPLEAGYVGRPVIASSAGCGMETVLHRETGWLVGGTDPVDWARALNEILQRRWDPSLLRSAALRFEPGSFARGLAGCVAALGAAPAAPAAPTRSEPAAAAPRRHLLAS